MTGIEERVANAIDRSSTSWARKQTVLRFSAHLEAAKYWSSRTTKFVWISNDTDAHVKHFPRERHDPVLRDSGQHDYLRSPAPGT